jgi:hypothetical protein
MSRAQRTLLYNLTSLLLLDLVVIIFLEFLSLAQSIKYLGAQWIYIEKPVK